jgi:hypothetical protein
VVIERIVLLGFKRAPKSAIVTNAAGGNVVSIDGSAAVTQAQELVLVEGEHGTTVIRRPNLPVDGAWTITFGY